MARTIAGLGGVYQEAEDIHQNGRIYQRGPHCMKNPIHFISVLRKMHIVQTF